MNIVNITRICDACKKEQEAPWFVGWVYLICWSGEQFEPQPSIDLCPSCAEDYGIDRIFKLKGS